MPQTVNSSSSMCPLELSRSSPTAPSAQIHRRNMRFGLISRLHTVAFTFLASVSLALADWSGWYEPAYTNGSTVAGYTNGYHYGVLRFQSNGEVRANLYGAKWVQTYTNYTSPTRGFTNTVTFNDGMWPEIYPWGNTINVARAFQTLGPSGDLLTNTSFVLYKELNLVPTSVLMQARDVWALDAIRATRERIAATGVDPWGSLLEGNLYDNNRFALAYVKDRIVDIIPKYVNTSILTNRMQTNGFTDIQMWTMTGLLARVGAPTNYFEFTPWTELGGSGSDSNAFTPIMTQTFTQVCRSTNICTNIFRVGTMLGSISYITNAATNGASVSLVTTNLGIAQGTNHLGYGWRYIRPILTNLQQTVQSVWLSTNKQYRYEYFYHSASDIPNGGGLLSDYCDFLWSTKQREFREGGIYGGPSWTWHGYSIEPYDGYTIFTNEPYNLTSNDQYVFAANIFVSYRPSYVVGAIFHTNASGLLADRQIYGRLYESRLLSGWASNQYEAAAGWPLVVTNTSGYEAFSNYWDYMTFAGTNSFETLPGNVSNAVVWGTNLFFRGPPITSLNRSSADCEEGVQLIQSDIFDNEIIVSDEPDESNWTFDLTIPSGFQWDSEFTLSVSPIVILDWTQSTNGFRYR